jgi:hypothetical protein
MGRWRFPPSRSASRPGSWNNVSGNQPARLDKAALERIIQRASELQTGSRDYGDDLTAEEILKLGKDVGIDEGYLQQAILEESTRAERPEAGGFLNRTFGPGIVSSQRVVQGEVDDVAAQLAKWIEENELMVLQRQQSGRLSWEPLGGFQAAIRRSTAVLGGGKRPFMLARAGGVTATIVRLEPGYCNVVLTATIKKERSSYVIGSSVAVGGSLITGAVLAVLSPFLLVGLAPIPIGLGLGWLVASRYRPVAERVQLGLECVLDQLERGAIKPKHQLPEKTQGLFGIIADEVKKAIKPENRLSQ